MKTTFVSLSVLFVMLAPTSFAQTSPEPVPKSKDQNIIIHKKGDSKEKTTIVIDGDKVTINGKPAEDYKGGDITIMNGNRFNHNAPMPPMPIAPLPPQGGTKMFMQQFNGFGNEAVLGVMSQSTENGATISSITKNSSAEKGGLKEGDVITKVGDDNIDDANDLVEAIGKHKPADKVSITYQRDKKQNTTTVILGKNKNQAFVWNNDENVLRNNMMNDFSFNEKNSKPELGLRVQDVENGSGVKVLNVNNDDSPAATAGLKEDDVITQINGKTVQSVKDLKDALANVKQGDDVTINYQRGSGSQTAKVHFPKPLQTSDL
ncbi:MAG: PDZ domain-containing protein [Bacteroidota bacterium]|nr:PDZ domain-containing protein [Bacteroidota bacterium]